MKTAMILAAGRGERLRPLTDTIPKPLCPIQGLPLIEHHIINLARAGFNKIIINHAHLGGQIRHYLGDGSRWDVTLCYAPEPPGGLETGGGLVNARSLLGNTPFITVNADIYTDFDFKQLHLNAVKYMHLVLVKPNATSHYSGDFGMVNDVLLNHPREYIFSGIACYHPQVLQYLKIGRYSVTPLIRQYAQQKMVTAQYYDGLWFDIGSMERLNAANQSLGIGVC